ncbi:hypothetical protein [Streptomonospora salina]|uniref:Uncharacterized protein n=1 Tax=Streptomonospora salina TaxID=104205 RepID=A0A841E2C1_9ACTN|nr:hypothetical protein [Streptomonospora salina]MBB5996852.1 hypothetical protein [Streptomonospora salina]
MWCQGSLEEVPAADRRSAALAVWERDPDEALLAAAARRREPGSPVLLRATVHRVIYHTYDAAGMIEGSDFALARPHPGTVPAEEIIERVNDRYRDELTRAVQRLPHAPRGAAWLWELDPHGATVWIGAPEGTGTSLVRVPWNRPAEGACQLERALFDFLTGDGPGQDGRPAPERHHRCRRGRAPGG